MAPDLRAHGGVQPRIFSLPRNATWFRWLALSLFSLLIGGAFFLIAPATASAHAEYTSSDPAMNAMLTKAPAVVTIHFSENVDPAGSDVVVYDVNGKQVSSGAAQVDRADLKTMQVNLNSDGSEIYVVNWHTVSAVEGHHDSGSFRFFVNISPMLQGMLNGKMSGSSMSSGPAMPSTPATPGTPLWMTALIGLLGLVVGGVVTFFVTQRRTSLLKQG